MKDSAEREARSEHPPADVEEAKRDAERLLETIKSGGVFVGPGAIENICRQYLSERTRREKMEEALREMTAVEDALLDFITRISARQVGEAEWRRQHQALCDRRAKARLASRASLESPQ